MSWEDEKFVVVDKRRNVPILVDIRIIDSKKTGAFEIAIGSILACNNLEIHECSNEVIKKLATRFEISEKQVIKSLKILDDVLGDE